MIVLETTGINEEEEQKLLELIKITPMKIFKRWRCFQSLSKIEHAIVSSREVWLGDLHSVADEALSALLY